MTSFHCKKERHRQPEEPLHKEEEEAGNSEASRQPSRSSIVESHYQVILLTKALIPEQYCQDCGTSAVAAAYRRCRSSSDRSHPSLPDTFVITKDDLLTSMTLECDIALHLHSKLTPQAAGYRPSTDQRSTTELLRYLAICGIAGTTSMVKGDWKLFAAFRERSAALEVKDFPAAMTRQKEELAALFAGITPEQFATQQAPMPGGAVTLPLGVAILNGPFKWLAAYKLELFVYAKASGAHDISTSNAWRGVDTPKK